MAFLFILSKKYAENKNPKIRCNIAVSSQEFRSVLNPLSTNPAKGLLEQVKIKTLDYLYQHQF